MLHLLHDLLRFECEDRESKQARHLELYHQGQTVPNPVWKENAIGASFVLLPPGQFLMGSPKDESGRDDDEDQAQVTLTGGFWMGQTVVTQSQWETVMETHPWNEKDWTKQSRNTPASWINHSEAIRFCERLTELDREAGRIPSDWEYRLPTEAEWEYACRAGTNTRYSFGDDESMLGDYAWCTAESQSPAEWYAHEVGLKKPNPWNLHDMHGNVSEWCQDHWSDVLPGGDDPVVDRFASNRIHRGGSWFSEPVDCRSACRSLDAPEYRDDNVGFRLSFVPSSQ